MRLLESLRANAFLTRIPATPALTLEAAHPPCRFGALPGDQFSRQTFDTLALLETRGDVSEGFRKQVARVLSETFSPKELRTLKENGYRFFCAETVETVVPSRNPPRIVVRGANGKPATPAPDTFQVEVGLFYTPPQSPETKYIIVAEYYKNPYTGERHPAPPVDSTLAEEVSHAIDHLYRKVSYEEAFVQAYREDLARLSDADRLKLSEAWCTPLEALDSRDLQGEIFASLLGTHKQGRTLDRDFPVLEKFPRSLKFVVEDFLPHRGGKYPVRDPNAHKLPRKIPVKTRSSS